MSEVKIVARAAWKVPLCMDWYWAGCAKGGWAHEQGIQG